MLLVRTYLKFLSPCLYHGLGPLQHSFGSVIYSMPLVFKATSQAISRLHASYSLAHESVDLVQQGGC